TQRGLARPPQFPGHAEELRHRSRQTGNPSRVAPPRQQDLPRAAVIASELRPGLLEIAEAGSEPLPFDLELPLFGQQRLTDGRVGLEIGAERREAAARLFQVRLPLLGFA